MVILGHAARKDDYHMTTDDTAKKQLAELSFSQRKAIESLLISASVTKAATPRASTKSQSIAGSDNRLFGTH